MNIEYYSNLAMATAAVVYLLAVAAYGLEWAAARRTDESEAERVAERELVGAGVGASSGAAVEVPPTPGVVQTTGKQPLTPAQRMEFFGRLGLGMMLLGFLSAAAGVVLRGIAAGRAPWGNMYEFTITALVFAVAVYLVLAFRGTARWLGLPMAMIATIGNGLAITVFYVAISPLVPALDSVWFVIHIVAAAISGAAFNVGGAASIVYLIKKRAEKRGPVTGYLARIPSTARIDIIAYRCLAFAFPLWTFTIAAGAVWAEAAWGRFWGWDPKETWALVSWVIYACYLHARVTAGWKGGRAAVIAIIGLVSFWWNFVGVNLLVSGLHSYAGI